MHNRKISRKVSIQEQIIWLTNGPIFGCPRLLTLFLGVQDCSLNQSRALLAIALRKSKYADQAESALKILATRMVPISLLGVKSKIREDLARPV